MWLLERHQARGARGSFFSVFDAGAEMVGIYPNPLLVIEALRAAGHTDCHVVTAADYQVVWCERCHGPMPAWVIRGGARIREARPHPVQAPVLPPSTGGRFPPCEPGTGGEPGASPAPPARA